MLPGSERLERVAMFRDIGLLLLPVAVCCASVAAQAGAPVGLILANAAFLAVTAAVSPEAGFWEREPRANLNRTGKRHGAHCGVGCKLAKAVSCINSAE